MTVQISSELEERLKFHSSQQNKSPDELLDEILRGALPQVAPRKKRDWIGMASSGRSDLSERVDELLFADLERRQ